MVLPNFELEKQEMIKIIDENEPTPTLDMIIDLRQSTRINRILGDNIPVEVRDYLKEATEKHNRDRQSRMTDKSLRDKLEVLLKMINTDCFNDKELERHSEIISKYRV